MTPSGCPPDVEQKAALLDHRLKQLKKDPRYAGNELASSWNKAVDAAREIASQTLGALIAAVRADASIRITEAYDKGLNDGIALKEASIKSAPVTPEPPPQCDLDPMTALGDCPACGLPMPHGPAGCSRTLRKWMAKERIWEKPEWYVRVLRDIAANIEKDAESFATHGLNKYSRGANMQKRENLKYAADYIEHLASAPVTPEPPPCAAIQEGSATYLPTVLPSEDAICSCGAVMVCPDIGCDRNKLPASEARPTTGWLKKQIDRAAASICPTCGGKGITDEPSEARSQSAPSAPEGRTLKETK